MINRTNVAAGSVNLFSVSNGMTSWWNLRLKTEIVSGAGAQVELKRNGQSFPTQDGGVFAAVDPTSYPERITSASVLLNDGDVVTAEVDGPGTVNISLSGEVQSEQL